MMISIRTFTELRSLVEEGGRLGGVFDSIPGKTCSLRARGEILHGCFHALFDGNIRRPNYALVPSRLRSFSINTM